MATSTITAANIASMALRACGDEAVTADDLTDNTLRRAQIVNEYYLSTLYATESEHPWNFNTKRATLYAYTLPGATLDPAAGAVTAGATGIVFAAGGDVFTAADIGRQIVTRVAGATGKATITGFTDEDEVTATIDVAFSSAAVIASQSWRLYYAYPAWGPSRSIAVPSDCLRVYRTENNEEYLVEQGYIVLSQESLNCRYSRQEPDTTLFPFPFVQAFAGHLAAIICGPITGNEAKADLLMKKYTQVLLPSAKALNAQEGTAETLESNALTDVRG